ncbi:unnamed protein product [Dracunculus medinensis]|uniref:Uncharacterized protein n=1 Tax=Dracunculus medinensis TaxID=318479 RepID=A0A0N4UIF6_DRAME|nr:unnamed protein product [Dracunculus medinensis]
MASDRAAWKRLTLIAVGASLTSNDGRLRISPDPARLAHYDYSFNNMTVVCSQQVDGKLQETDVVVNVDSLIGDDDNNGRYRMDDFESLPKNFKEIVHTRMNIKIGIGYGEWSCCTACCCTSETCSYEYALSSKECDKLESYRTRLAYLSFFKINPYREIKVAIARNIHIQQAIITFDKYLSTAPYHLTGIPIYSTLLRTDQNWKTLQRYLLAKLIKDKDYFKTIKGKLGQFVESESCNDMKEKFDCRILDEYLEYAVDAVFSAGSYKEMQIILNNVSATATRIGFDEVPDFKFLGSTLIPNGQAKL